MAADVRPRGSMGSPDYNHHRSNSSFLDQEGDPRRDHRQHRQHQVLPSFREILPPPLHSAIDSATESSKHIQPLHEPHQPHPLSSRPPGSALPSPNQSQSSSMPDTFDELGQPKTYDSLNQFGQQRSSSTWSSSTGYPEMATSYAQRQPFYSQPMAPMKHESGLPPIRDMGFASPNIPSATYNMYGQTPQGPTPMQYGQMRRDSYNDGRALSQTYPPYSRPYHQTMEKYEPAYINNSLSRMYPQSTGYTPNYATDYTPQPAIYHTMDHDGRNRKRRGNLPKHITETLRHWLLNHLDHPYPSEEEKNDLMARTGLSMAQISNWFINARRRHWPAMKEKAQQQQNSLKQEAERSR